jgi:hypothetical protein
MDDRREQIHQYLRDVARKQRKITYGDVADHIGLDPKNLGHLNNIATLLTKINEIENAARRPLLSAVVVNKQSGMPGRGFFNSARQLRQFHGQTDEEKRAFFEKELAAVHRYWARQGG